MKTLFKLLMVFVFTTGVFSQAPEKMSYQAVIRNNNNQLVTNHPIGMQISILLGSIDGTAVYIERHFPTTNSNGLVTLEIGTGLVLSGNFSTIEWANSSYFIKTETDLNGGVSYTMTGTSQLLSVPFALHAKTVANYSETDPLFATSAAAGISGTNITNWNTAFGWGNHSGLYRSVSWLPAWNDVAGKPSFASVATSGSYNDLLNLPELNITGWNTAFGWGNHSGLYRPASWVPAWTDVTNKPTDFTPSAHNHAATEITSGTLTVARGGTGAGTHTSGNVLIGNGNSAITSLSRSGIDTRASFPPTAHNHAAAEITSGTLAVARGGTGISSYTTGNYIYASGVSTLAQRTPSQVRTDIGAGTVSSIATGNGITGGTITTTGTLGLTGQALALHNLGSSGIIARTGTGTVAARAIIAGTGIIVNNGSGVGGNPTISTKPYAVGDFAHGGIVFWVDGSGQHGLVCAKEDSPNTEEWDVDNTGEAREVIADGPLAGKMNTAILIARLEYDACAAWYCYLLKITEGGKTYGDWYLPSKEELNLMYQNKTTINWHAVYNGGNTFADGRYWSSSGYSTYNAWAQDFVTGVQNITDKSSKFYVRAVRSF